LIELLILCKYLFSLSTQLAGGPSNHLGYVCNTLSTI
jgi:hypothetical protein